MPTPEPDPALTDPEMYGPRPSDPPGATFVIYELDVDWDGHDTPPPRAPIGPFPTRADAAVHAQAWVDRYRGGSFGVGPLTTPTLPPPKTNAELLDQLEEAVETINTAVPPLVVKAAQRRRDDARDELLGRLEPRDPDCHTEAEALAATDAAAADGGARLGLSIPGPGRWVPDGPGDFHVTLLRGKSGVYAFGEGATYVCDGPEVWMTLPDAVTGGRRELVVTVRAVR